MPNVQWKKPHATFFAGIQLFPGEEGNPVTAEQLAALKKDKTFGQCEFLGIAVVADGEEAVQELRNDGPTLKEWVNNGNHELAYPPRGFAAKGVEAFKAEQQAALEAAAKAEADAKAKTEADEKAKAEAAEKVKADEKAKAEAAAKADADAKAAAAGKPKAETPTPTKPKA